ncbi:MAG: HAMP domain-containing protein [Sedimentisphaerales bacterium]|nr:HAMP domain-containing protein [Sedimentisphaerales bacterium]
MALSKWYRPSFSLAAKCRLGFALAVLLIIGTALYFPYRWMDKLVEQNRRELAIAEVQHLLERHFQSAQNLPGATLPGLSLRSAEATTLKISTPPPPPAPIDPNKPVTPAVKPAGAPALESGELGGAEQQPAVTAWQPIIRLLKFSGMPLPAVGNDAAQPPQPSEETIAALADAFVERGVKRFLRHPDRADYFVLHDETMDINDQTLADQGEGTFLGPLQKRLPFGRPARYLRAIRAEAGCLAESCHGAGLDKSEAAEPAAGKPRSFREGELVGAIEVIIPAGQTAATRMFNLFLIIIAGLLAGICAMVTFYLITQRFILEPVRRLRQAADSMTIPTEVPAGESSAADSPDPPVGWDDILTLTESIKTGDEFERLAQAFHQMLARLKLAQDRLRETNRALDMRLDELQAKNVALFEANKLKSEFLANVSHELRTPLNAIIGFAEIVRDRAAESGDEKTRRYSANVLESGRLLLSIVNNLLDLAKIEAGKLELRLESCSIANVVEALINFTRPLAENKQLNINLQIDPGLGLVHTDAGKLQQIFFNLLSNAIKFTPQQGRIDLRVQDAPPDHFRISVEDTGPGIAPEDRAIIFEKFHQLDATITREHPGAGLGLAIVKELVGVLGGAITVGGEVGRGAIFTVTLPKNPSEIKSA